MSNKSSDVIKLSVNHIVKSFDNKTVLKDLSFEVYDGEFLSILGPSGCGKTTLLRILMGLEQTDSGTVFLGKTNITNARPNERHMGIVFQDYALFENMNVFENVEYALRFNKKLASKRKEISLNTIEAVGLSDFKDSSVQDLSGGQRQRVSIARTLALNPEIILFDEPMSALDVETRLSLRTILKDIQKTFGTTMIYITHDQEEAFALSDRVMVMGGGSIHQLDTPEVIINNPSDEYVSDFVVKNIKIKMDSLSKYMD